MLALALLVLGSSAEEPKESEIASIAATTEYRHLVVEFARCLAERNRAEASDFALRKNIEWTRSGQWTIRKLIDKGCVPAQATPEQAQTLRKLTPDMLRSSIADALVRLEFPASDPNIVAAAQPLPSGSLVESLWPSDGCKKCNAAQRKQLEEVKTKAAASMAPYVFGECAVRADPNNAHRLLMAEVNSASETYAFAALAPAFGQCVAEGSKGNLSRTVLRGLIALSYYRLAHAPRVAVAAGASN